MDDPQLFWDAAVPMTVGVAAIWLGWSVGSYLFTPDVFLGLVSGPIVALGGTALGCRYLAEGVSMVVHETLAEATSNV